MDEIDGDAKSMIESIENVIKEPTVRALDHRVRNLKYKIKETEALLKQNALVLDQNTQKAMRAAIERDRRSLITAEKDFDKKLAWYVNKVLDDGLESMMGRATEKGATE